MREILFRGKLLATGEWAYGNLDIKPGGKVAVITPDDTPLGKYGAVDPATVGQYTGLTDKNGVKIFEGDIIEFPWGVGKEKDYVCFRDFMFTLSHFWKSCIENGTVIGNIYDNPELLEGDTKNEME